MITFILIAFAVGGIVFLWANTNVKKPSGITHSDIIQADKKPFISNISERNGKKLIDFHFPSKPNSLFAVEVLTDEFENSIIIQPKSISSMNTDKIWLDTDDYTDFRIGLRTINAKNYLTISAYQKHMKLNIGDKLSFLFNDDSKCEVLLEEKGYRFEKESDGIILETKIEIDIDFIKRLKDSKITKWRFYDEKNKKAYSSYLTAGLQFDFNALAEMQLLACAEIFDKHNSEEV